MAQRRRIRTLLPMACDGFGPSQTCLNIARGIHTAGTMIDVFANRRKIPPPNFPMKLSLSGPILSKIPYRIVEKRASQWLEKKFIRSIEPDDIAYVWPGASLEVHYAMHERGVPVIMEAINTRMAYAREILDAAYIRFGVEPSHDITEERIAEQEEKFRMATAIFAPNRNVEASLKGSPIEERILPSSYGVDTSLAASPHDYSQKDSLTFLFCGFACLRKGIHLLLDAWAGLPNGHRLQILGNIEPVIAERYADLLSSDRVEYVGFVRNVHDYMSKADAFVLPSLEEGDPLVTYEAASHGLPIIASPMGASRLGDIDDTMLIVEPEDRDAFEDALARMIGSAELRSSLGRTARSHSAKFDWLAVGARRGAQLETSKLLNN